MILEEITIRIERQGIGKFSYNVSREGFSGGRGAIKTERLAAEECIGILSEMLGLPDEVK